MVPAKLTHEEMVEAWQRVLGSFIHVSDFVFIAQIGTVYYYSVLNAEVLNWLEEMNEVYSTD